MERDKLLKGMEDRKVLFGLFFSFGNRLQTAGDTFYEEITCKQFFLLICLSLFGEEPPTLKELAEVMGSSHQNVKQIANKLEENGFVTIFPDYADKRKLRIQTTEKMKRLGEKYRIQEEDFMEKLYEGITDKEIAVTRKSMTRIEKNLIELRMEKEAGRKKHEGTGGLQQ